MSRRLGVFLKCVLTELYCNVVEHLQLECWETEASAACSVLTRSA